MSNKICRQVIIAHTPVHLSTSLPEDVLQSVIAYVDEKFNRHEKAINYKSDEDKKIDALIITMLDVAAELVSARQEIKKLKQLDSDYLAEVDLMNKRLDELSNQIEK